MSKKTCDACGSFWDLPKNMFEAATFQVQSGSGEVECDGCSGRGKDKDGNTCLLCDGDGKVRCPKCGGTGYLDDDDD